MKIIMDMQATQSEGSANRGIGRYTYELARGINKILNDCIFAYNSLYRIGKLSNSDILFDIVNFSSKNLLEKYSFDCINDYLMKKQFLKFEADLIHVHSPFEGGGGKASVLLENSYLKDVYLTATLYDLIPLIYKEQYLGNKEALTWYMKKLKLYYEADYIFAISESAKEDAINILGIPTNRVINISGAIDSNNFYKLNEKSKKIAKSTLEKFDIKHPFIMYTGGIDFRKNIEASIKAFAKLNKKLIEEHQYVIVCKITDTEREHFKSIINELKIPKNKIIFTGFVSDKELNDLYNLCKLFIFPSIYEGFGLPVLEAMSCGTIVIGSNVSSIPEIIDREDCMFVPTDIEDISMKMTNILTNQKLQNELRTYFYNRSKEFSWDKSARKTITAYKDLEKKEKKVIKKLKVAFFSPLPKLRSGIADYSNELLPFLSKYFDLDIYVNDIADIESQYIESNFKILSHTEFEKNRNRYENILYQFGNSDYHHYMLDYILKYNGVVVLHDFFIGDMIQLATNIKEADYFIKNLLYSHGNLGAEYFQKFNEGKINISDIIIDLPINKKVIDSASGIIVHSNYSKELFNKYYDDDYSIKKINQLIKTPSKKILSEKNKYKKLLGYNEADIIISVFGHISESKQYDFILKSMYEGKLFKNNVYLVFVGSFNSIEYEHLIQELIKKYKIEKQVKVTGFVSNKEYKNYLLVSDIGINLRINSRGETSRALLMNMAYGLPTIINDYASFSELPDNATCKVELNSKNDFIKKIKELISNKNYRNKVSENAYQYIVKEHNIDQIAKEYYEFVFNNCSSISTKDKNTDIIESIADIIVTNELDVNLNDNEYREISTIVHKILN